MDMETPPPADPPQPAQPVQPSTPSQQAPPDPPAVVLLRQTRSATRGAADAAYRREVAAWDRAERELSPEDSDQSNPVDSYEGDEGEPDEGEADYECHRCQDTGVNTYTSEACSECEPLEDENEEVCLGGAGCTCPAPPRVVHRRM